MKSKLALLCLLAALPLTGCKKMMTLFHRATGTPVAQQAAAPATAAPPKARPAPAAPAPSPAFHVNQSSQVIVYGYHRLVNVLHRPDTEILPADFESQMKMLKDRGLPVIPLQDFLAWRRGEKNIPARCAVITLDDGWKSQYDVAWPILKKYGYPFTLFIYTEYVKPGKLSGGESMTWDTLAEMRDAGVDIESHTLTHPYLTAKKGKTEAQYEDWLYHEVNDSKKVLEYRSLG